MNIGRYGLLAVAVLSLSGWISIARAAPASVTESRREAVMVEREFRDRLATLHRLREIAMEHDAIDRLAGLDELLELLRSENADRISRVTSRMSALDAARLRDMLDEGRDWSEWVHRHRGNVDDRDRADPGRHEVRAAARQRARGEWSEARRHAVAKDGVVRHRTNAASRLAARRWRDEARDRDIERWYRAARRSGMLDTAPASPSVHLPSQAECDARKAASISPEDADAEFRRLRAMIMSD